MQRGIEFRPGGIEYRPATRGRFLRGPRSVCSVVCSVSFIAVLSFSAASEARAQSEDQIKAAFLFNFARYVEWPESAFPNPGSSVRICLMGSPDFSAVVSETVSGKSVGDRRVEVEQRIEVGKASDCHILYVGDDASVAAADLASQLLGGSVFTVADRDGFAEDGGIANFFRADKKIRFEINPTAARNAGLKVSSQLLRLAKVVK